VPTDFSEACDNALNHAIEMAKYLKCKVHVLHVVDSLSKTYFAKDLLQVGAIIEDSVDEMNASMVQLKKYVAAKNNEAVFPVVKEGDIFTTINDVAIALNAGMIVLGTHGKIGFQRIVGSYALKVIDSTKVPVIIVQKRSFGSGFKDIIFPVNIQDEDRQKAEYAVQMAKLFNSTIHVLPKSVEGSQNKIRLDGIVKQICLFFEKYEVKHSVVDVSEYGEAWDRQVLNYSSSVDADLILILSNPDKHMMFFEAKEENIIFNSAQIPVMCINYRKLKISDFWGSYSPNKSNVY
jgi:nucleotide-binding universal stress UspA family protein